MTYDESIDPTGAGLANAASIIGKLSAPSRTPVSLGSILGQGAGAFVQGRNAALKEQEVLANQKMLRQAQAEDLQERAAARRAAAMEKQERLIKTQRFNSILGQMVKTGQQPDEISILSAGIESGAFGPQETSAYMEKVLAKKADRERKIEEAQAKRDAAAATAEERKAWDEKLLKLKNEMTQENMRLAQTLRPRQEKLLPVEGEDGTVTYVAESEAKGKKVPPPRRDARGLPPNAIKELGDKGELATNFIRLSGNFKDEYGGKGSSVVGDAQNLVGRNIGAGYSGQADWWQDYQNEKNKVRNKLFGSALTATESGEFEKAAINPGMTADMIRKNLARQKQMAVRAAKKLAGAYQAGGYNEQQIFEALGISPDELAGADAKDPWE